MPCVYLKIGRVGTWWDEQRRVRILTNKQHCNIAFFGSYQDITRRHRFFTVLSFEIKTMCGF